MAAISISLVSEFQKHAMFRSEASIKVIDMYAKQFAYNYGFNAFVENIPRDENPYDECRVLYVAWDRGWMASREIARCLKFETV